jgi:hypothetical protein
VLARRYSLPLPSDRPEGKPRLIADAAACRASRQEFETDGVRSTPAMPSIPGSSTGVTADAVACGGAVVDGFAASTARRSDLSRCLSKASTPEQTAAPAPSGVRFPTLPLLFLRGSSQSVLGRVQCRYCAGLRPSAAKDGSNGQLPAVSGGSAQRAPSRFSNACNTWTTSRAAFITPLHLLGRPGIRPHFIDQDVGLILVA